MEIRLAKILAKLKITYGTSDPFELCNFLNIDLRWVDMNQHPLGKTSWILGESIILLDKSIQDNSRRYFVCAHELAHFFDDKGFAGYYVANRHYKGTSETQADSFATGMIYSLYLEEHQGEEPETVQELSAEYGLPIYGENYL
ncbi:ImmA/IrrE family metallo-endopeptidase [Loigolactobacillus backii]|uniref:ImmA/IrrE family metallo-endopeptidase n=1 Tax=Loigolactobacillus backii TaxID=375175 RepID=UPI0022FD586B|nr:ImmA/IrrE family metallo-endopeptidase [Loigolactobacillus backii]MDA5386985.1 ImmA/IrrE family metallo-endopeptidase [Loigolactobacillus backii]MDA5389523.1 ImmA/IrrE family metallo-endopeptidase [Loigolactobacillus backii]